MTKSAAFGDRSVNRRWLLLVHQLPAQPSNLRVQTWRRLQQLGAIPIKQAVYALPDTAAAREDFEWLKTEIIGAGGEATVFAADNVDTWSDDALVAEFKRTREAAYKTLAKDIERKTRGRTPPARRTVDAFRQRLAAIEHIDFFAAPGRDHVADLLRAAEARLSPSPERGQPVMARKKPHDYTGRVWATRPRPGVDRMASAWLIGRFIDAKPRFVFASAPADVPRSALPFDMFGVEFSHHGDRCTFETLCAMFGIDDPAVARIATIVHDLDLKDDRYGAVEAETVARLIDGMQLAISDDAALLNQGIAMFESLYRSFAQSTRPARTSRANPSRRS